MLTGPRSAREEGAAFAGADVRAAKAQVRVRRRALRRTGLLLLAILTAGSAPACIFDQSTYKGGGRRGDQGESGDQGSDPTGEASSGSGLPDLPDIPELPEPPPSADSGARDN